MVFNQPSITNITRIFYIAEKDCHLYNKQEGTRVHGCLEISDLFLIYTRNVIFLHIHVLFSMYFNI